MKFSYLFVGWHALVLASGLSSVASRRWLMDRRRETSLSAKATPCGAAGEEFRALHPEG